MKKIFLSFLGVSLLILSSCKKSELQQANPNLPSPTTSLTTEGGLLAYSAGILERTNFPVPNEGNSNILTIAMTQQAITGDEQFVPYGNYGFRWTDQVYKITLPGGTVVTNPNGNTQQQHLQGTNSRSSADVNAFIYEWTIDYFFISQSNTILNSLKNPNISFTGDAATKRAVFAAWAYWWKGFFYSRLGSTYLSGVIATPDGSLNSGFVAHDALITEANKDFDSCIAILNTIDPASIAPDASDDYSQTMKKIVLIFNDNADIVTPAMWIHGINSYKARNLLVNKKVADMGAGDWQQIITLCNTGLTSTDFYFKFGMYNANPTLDLSNGFLHPLALIGPNVQFAFLSERLVQDFKPGDARFKRNVEPLPTTIGLPIVVSSSQSTVTVTGGASDSSFFQTYSTFEITNPVVNGSPAGSEDTLDITNVSVIGNDLVLTVSPDNANQTIKDETLGGAIMTFTIGNDPLYGLSAFTNIRSRGLQFGTRWAAMPIENGGAWATGVNQGTVPFGPSYEETALMLAEAYINTGQIDQGLQYVDAVRDFQTAGLAHVSGTGLTLDQAKEELRKERRIALCQRGLAFFDARRWGVTAPATSGGGRAGGIVYVPKTAAGTPTDVALPCFMEYNYMDYWDVPQNELDFNTPATGSAPVKN